MTIEELRDAVFDWCEDTEEQASVQVAGDVLDEASKQFWRGSACEAKGIRRTIGEAIRVRELNATG